MRHTAYTWIGLLAFALIFSLGCSTPLKQAAQFEKAGNYQDAVAAYEQVIQTNPDSEDARQAQLKIAALYRDKLDQPEEAIARYKQVAEQSPGTEEAAEALYQAGVQLFKLGTQLEEADNKEDAVAKYDETAEILNKTVNEYPESKWGHFAQQLLAKTYEKAGNMEQASEVYASFARRSQDSQRSVQALLNKARLDKEMGKQESATQALQEAIKKYGNDPEAAKELDKAKAELEDMGASIPNPEAVDPRAQRRQERRDRNRPRSSFYGRSQSSAGAGSTTYTNSFNVNPDDLMRDMQIQADEQGTIYDAMFMIANMFYSMEDYNSAGALYERGIQMARNAGSKLDPQNYRKLADCYAKIGLQAKADETLQKAAKADPQVIDSIIESGNFEYQSGNYAKAIETYSSAIGILPAKDADIYYHLGLAYQKSGDADKELEYFERAVAARPSEQDALQHLAEVLAYRKGNRPRAEIYQDLVDGRSNTYEMQKELADLCFRYKNYQWAKTKYTNAARVAERKASRSEDEAEIAKLKQQALSAYVLAAVANVYRGKVDEGKAAFEALVAENPGTPAVHLGNGYFALHAGDPDTAIAEFQAALELEPGYRDAAIAMGEYYLSVGKMEKAVEVWQEYIKHNRSDRSMWARTRNLQKQLKAAAQPEETSAQPEETSAQPETPPAANP